MVQSTLERKDESNLAHDFIVILKIQLLELVSLGSVNFGWHVCHVAVQKSLKRPRSKRHKLWFKAAILVTLELILSLHLYDFHLPEPVSCGHVKFVRNVYCE